MVLAEVVRSRRATSANPAVSCEGGGGSSVSGQTGTGAVERGVAAAAGERVDIAGDGAFAVPAASGYWIVRSLQLLLLYLGDRPTNVCFREVIWLAVLSTHPPSLAGEEATASPCGVDKAWTVGIGTCKGSVTWVDWLLPAVAGGSRGWCSMRRRWVF